MDIIESVARALCSADSVPPDEAAGPDTKRWEVYIPMARRFVAAIKAFDAHDAAALDANPALVAEIRPQGRVVDAG